MLILDIIQNEIESVNNLILVSSAFSRDLPKLVSNRFVIEYSMAALMLIYLGYLSEHTPFKITTIQSVIVITLPCLIL